MSWVSCIFPLMSSFFRTEELYPVFFKVRWAQKWTRWDFTDKIDDRGTSRLTDAATQKSGCSPHTFASSASRDDRTSQTPGYASSPIVPSPSPCKRTTAVTSWGVACLLQPPPNVCITECKALVHKGSCYTTLKQVTLKHISLIYPGV